MFHPSKACSLFLFLLSIFTFTISAEEIWYNYYSGEKKISYARCTLEETVVKGKKQYKMASHIYRYNAEKQDFTLGEKRVVYTNEKFLLKKVLNYDYKTQTKTTYHAKGKTLKKTVNGRSSLIPLSKPLYYEFSGLILKQRGHLKKGAKGSIFAMAGDDLMTFQYKTSRKGKLAIDGKNHAVTLVKIKLKEAGLQGSYYLNDDGIMVRFVGFGLKVELVSKETALKKPENHLPSTKNLLSNEGHVQITVPETMEKDKFSTHAVLQAYDNYNKMFVLVTEAPTPSTTAPNMTDMVVNNALKIMQNKFSDFEVKSRKEKTIDSLQTFQIEFNGAESATTEKVGYLIAIIFTDNKIFQITCRSGSLQHFAKAKSSYEAIIDSFRVTKKLNFTTLKSNDGRFQLSLPLGFQVTQQLHQEADLQAFEVKNQHYLIAFFESKEGSGLNLQNYFSIIQSQILTNAPNAKITSPKESITIDGHNAMKVELSATMQGVEIQYNLTAIETSEHLSYVMQWTTSANFPKLKSKMEQIAASFQDNEQE